MTRVEPRPRAERTAAPAARQPSRPFAAALREAGRRPAAARQAKAAASQRLAEARDLGARAAPPDERTSPVVAGPREAASLRAIVRTLPVTLAGLCRWGEGPRLSEGVALDLGRALSVELRPTSAGLELVLRPSPEVARVAAAELPALVRALRERGLQVSAALVRPRGPAAGTVRPRGSADSVRREPGPPSP